MERKLDSPLTKSLMIKWSMSCVSLKVAEMDIIFARRPKIACQGVLVVTCSGWSESINVIKTSSYCVLFHWRLSSTPMILPRYTRIPPPLLPFLSEQLYCQNLLISLEKYNRILQTCEHGRPWPPTPIGFREKWFKIQASARHREGWIIAPCDFLLALPSGVPDHWVRLWVGMVRNCTFFFFFVFFFFYLLVGTTPEKVCSASCVGGK